MQTPDCSDCVKCGREEFSDGGVICCGVAYNPLRRFDTVAICIKQAGQPWRVQKWAPDEAMILVSLLCKATRAFLMSFHPYREFRLLSAPKEESNG